MHTVTELLVLVNSSIILGWPLPSACRRPNGVYNRRAINLKSKIFFQIFEKFAMDI